MKTGSFRKWFAGLEKLSERQRQAVLEHLRTAFALDRLCAAIETATPARLCCPGCQGEQHHKHGRDRGLQRYRCLACGKTFSRLTGTPLARLRHRALWLDYLERMLDAQSVRKAANALGVHRNTSFRWRHRFLTWVKHDRPALLGGIAEADELFILESQKGSRTLDRPARKRGGTARWRGINRDHDCILVARDRSGATFDFVTGRGALTKGQLCRHLLPVLERDVLLVSDAHAAYRAFARDTGISHEYVNLNKGERVRGAIHVQNVNGYHRRLRAWLVRFHGVASHYLPNYLGWRWAVDGTRIATAEQFLRAALGCFNTKR